MNVLRYFITSKAKRNVLKLFLSHLDSAFYTREVARLTAEPINAARRELGYLEKAGLLRSYPQGNLKYYHVVKTFPLLAEWQKIILFTPDTEDKTAPSLTPASPTGRALEVQAGEHSPQEEEAMGEPAKQPTTTLAGVVDILRSVFNPLSAVGLAIIYGKAATSEVIPEDGIDLLVVGDLPADNLLALLADVEDRTGVSINPVRMTHSDFGYRNARGDPLIRRIWSEKKLIVKGRH